MKHIALPGLTQHLYQRSCRFNIILLLVQDITAGQDDDEISELLDNMSPTQPWAEPPLNPPFAPDADPIAAGEESVARLDEAQRVSNVAAFPPLHLPAPDQMPDNPLEPAFLEPEPAADYALAVVQLLTSKEIEAQQQPAQPVGLRPNAAVNLQPSQAGQRQHQSMLGSSVAPLQAGPPQQPGVMGQYPPVQQPGPSAAYPPQQAPGFGVRPAGGLPPFRPPPRPLPTGPPQHQGSAIMRPFKVRSSSTICHPGRSRYTAGVAALDIARLTRFCFPHYFIAFCCPGISSALRLPHQQRSMQTVWGPASACLLLSVFSGIVA